MYNKPIREEQGQFPLVLWLINDSAYPLLDWTGLGCAALGQTVGGWEGWVAGRRERGRKQYLQEQAKPSRGGAVVFERRPSLREEA